MLSNFLVMLVLNKYGHMIVGTGGAGADTGAGGAGVDVGVGAIWSSSPTPPPPVYISCIHENAVLQFNSIQTLVFYIS